MASPIIGVCAAYERARWSIWDMPAAILPSTYLEHLAHSGAVPLAFIPSEQTISHAQELIGRVDGLLLLGGADVDPSQYGEEPDPKLEPTVLIRDRTEMALVRAAMEKNVPILGVCRGMQVMNVVTGGTLIQDIGAIGSERHRPTPGYLDDAATHSIVIEPDSWIGQVYGDTTRVNSHHHQVVRTLGRGGQITATSPDDGVIEAIEWDTPALTVGVQWHPEASELGGVIARFIDACPNRATSNQNTGSTNVASHMN